jgi:hypothetical protein
VNGVRRGRLAAVFFCLATLAGCGGGSHHGVAVSSLRALVLQPGQMRSYQQFDVGRQTRSDLHPGPRGDPLRFGREGGWKARFRRGGATPSTPGPLVVESRADAFASSGGAKRDLAAYEEEWKQTAMAAGATSAVSFDVHGLGDEARGVDLLQGTQKAGQRLIVVAWRRGTVTASVSATGIAGKLTRGEAIALARRQDAAVERAA